MPARSEPTERMCIATRAVRPVGELIRFVEGPDGEVVADLRRRLPGRGVWVTAEAARVAEAEKKRLFARAFKADIRVAPGLSDRVGAQIEASLRGALSLARKAGAVVTGFAKVEAALEKGRVAALIHASDAAEDGIRKLAAAARRSGGAAAPKVIRSLSSSQLDLALGGAHVIHAALLAGPASDHVLERIGAFERYNATADEAAPMRATSPDGTQETAGPGTE